MNPANDLSGVRRAAGKMFQAVDPLMVKLCWPAVVRADTGTLTYISVVNITVSDKPTRGDDMEHLDRVLHKRRPRTDPCGTPNKSNVTTADRRQPLNTCWDLSDPRQHRASLSTGRLRPIQQYVLIDTVKG